ncbi:MAG: twin-arginine translocase subunit TatC [Candidatus Rokubacteria bacterium]|nr:twin-arginine translocase subunit TatC [Candidatus Rokubacteria bacterium]
MADEQTAPESEPEQERALGKMSFMQHLGELRIRIMWALGAAGIGLVIAFFVTDPAMRFISRPLAGLKIELVFTSPTEASFRYHIDSETGMFRDRFGTASHIDGHWRIARETYCQDLTLAGGSCF